MTCVVGIVRNDRIWMGADSAFGGSDNLDVLGPDNSKVFSKKIGNDTCLIGVSGIGSFLQLVEHRVEWPPLPDLGDQTGMMQWFAVEVVDAFRLALRRRGIMTTKDGVDSVGGTILIGIRGRLYEMGGALFVKAVIDPFAAIGSGYQEALGLLYGARKFKVESDPETLVQAALEAAERWNPNVRAPFQVIHS